MIMTFNDYKNNTLLESIRKLKLINKILKLAKFKNKLVINGEDSKIYLKSNNHNSDIEGAIIYPIANKIAFRIQNKLDGMPQGKPHLLDFEKVYNDLFSSYIKNKKDDNDQDLKVAEKVIDSFLETIKSFFKEKSFEEKPKDKVLGLTLGTDYSSMVYSKY